MISEQDQTECLIASKWMMSKIKMNVWQDQLNIYQDQGDWLTGSKGEINGLKVNIEPDQSEYLMVSKGITNKMKMNI